MNRPYHFLPCSRERAVRAVLLLGTAVVAGASLLGCEEQPANNRNYVLTRGPADENNLKQMGLAVANYDQLTASGDKSKDAAKPSTPAEAPPATPRKIIYDARIDLIVDSLNATEQAILKLIKTNNAFVAESDRSSLTSVQPHATWRVRVPVDQFDAFVESVSRLGEVRQQHIGSQDVTAEFVDIEARMRNKQEEEKRLLKHLNESTGKLEDILAVERELARVRGEIESTQGRLKFLGDRTALSTVTIEAMEWKDFKSPVVASFPSQIGRTFSTSVGNLLAFGKGLLLLLVALAPWAPVIVIGLVLLIWMIRAAGRSSRRKLIRVGMPAQTPA
jgi:hypothetical protein